MLLRCCTTTLLLLVTGCAHCHYYMYRECLEKVCEFDSSEDGEVYTTRVTLIGNGMEELYLLGFASHTVNAEGTVISQVDVFCPVNVLDFEEGSVKGTYWFKTNPFMEIFWSSHWPGVNYLTVNVYNMSVNQTYVSKLREDWLTELELTGNNWPSTSHLILKLPRLKILNLTDNRIETLHRGLLEGCYHLEVVDLSRNKIGNSLDVENVLEPVQLTLKEINLAENMLTNVRLLLLGVKKTNLSYNRIRFLDVDDIRREWQVDLSFNNITEFSYRNYDRLFSIRVDRMFLAGQNISRLSEVGTILSNFNKEMFEQICNVLLLGVYYTPDVLYFTQSQCTAHRKFIYCKQDAYNIFHSNCTRLVNLRGNPIKINVSLISEIWVEDLLDLSENNLKDLNEFPAQISRTKHLNLTRNSIGYISRQLFQNMTRLTVLDLSYNQLKHVQLILYSSLRMLDISNNNLNRTNISHSSSIYTTEYLNLSHNSFANILKDEWSQFDQFSKVDLGENYLQCCGTEMQYSRSLIAHIKNKLLNINSSKTLTCVRPYYGRVEMTDTWLSEDHCQFNVQGWVGFGCLVLLLPLIIHGVDLIDYFMHQTERDLAEQLIRLKNQGLEEDENCAMECQYDAFVCHSHKDARWVRYELLPNLENDRYGHRLCIHYRDFELGSFIEENLEEAMNTSRKVIVVVTRSFLQSNWCKMELTFAWEKMVREGRNYIIVIEVDRIPKDKRPPILSYLMRSRTYLEWPEAPTDDEKQHCWSRVRDALGKSLRDRQQELSESGIAVFQMEC